MEKNFILPIILRLLKRKSKEEGDRNFGEENKDFKNGGDEYYHDEGNFIHPCLATYVV